MQVTQLLEIYPFFSAKKYLKGNAKASKTLFFKLETQKKQFVRPESQVR